MHALYIVAPLMPLAIRAAPGRRDTADILVEHGLSNNGESNLSQNVSWNLRL
jgi:hypothetical protein